MDIVRVLLGPDAARPKPDLPLVVVDPVHSSHHPRSASDLVLHVPGARVVKIKVIPAVSLGHPDHVVRLRLLAVEKLPRVINKRRALLVNYSRCVPVLRVDGDDSQHLVPALTVQESEAARVGGPT